MNSYELMLSPIDDLRLSTRLIHCLNSNNIYYVGDLVRCDTLDLIRLKGFGIKSLCDVNKTLAENGLSLRSNQVY